MIVQATCRPTNKPQYIDDTRNASTYEDAQAPLIDIVFGAQATAWLARQQKTPSNSEVLTNTVTTLAADNRLKAQLEHPSGEHTMATVLRRCVELDLNLGTKNIREFHKALARVGVSCYRVSMTLESFLLLSAGMSYPAVQNLFINPAFTSRPPEDRFVNLVMTLGDHKLLGKSQNLGHIYSGLPAEIKAQTKKIDLPLAELRALRKNLQDKRIADLLSSESFKKLSPEDAFVELVCALDEHQLLGNSQNLGQIYSGLPAEIKAKTKCINLPLAELQALRKNLQDKRVADLLSSESFEKLSPEDAFVELVCALDQHELLGKSQNLGQVYSGLPAEIKAKTKCIKLPLAELRALRKNLQDEKIKTFLSSESFKKLSPEDAFVTLVCALDEHELLGKSQNLGQIYSGLPAEIKAKTTKINLPLAELRALWKNLQDERIADFLSSDRFKKLSPEDAFVELVCALDEHELLGKSQNLGQIYSGLPAEIKAKTTRINLPRAELKGIRSFLHLPETATWIEATLPNYPREERLQILLEKYNEQAEVKTTRLKLFQALPNQLSASVYKGDLTTASLRLDLPEQTVFFDSSEERIVAQLLFKYGLIEEFIEGQNLHVVSGNSKISLDFKIGNVFLEYHPLSRRDRNIGLSLEEAGARKKSSVSHEKYPDHEVIHIWKLRQLHEVLATPPTLSAMLSPEFRNLSMQNFIQDVRAAKAQGHTIDRAVQASSRALAF